MTNQSDELREALADADSGRHFPLQKTGEVLARAFRDMAEQMSFVQKERIAYSEVMLSRCQAAEAQVESLRRELVEVKEDRAEWMRRLDLRVLERDEARAEIVRLREHEHRETLASDAFKFSAEITRKDMELDGLRAEVRLRIAESVSITAQYTQTNLGLMAEVERLTQAIVDRLDCPCVGAIHNLKKCPYFQLAALQSRLTQAEVVVEAADDILDDDETNHQIDVGSTGYVVRCSKLKKIREALRAFKAGDAGGKK